MFRSITIYKKKYVCTESCIRIFLHKSKIKSRKENIVLLFFTVLIVKLTKQRRIFLVTAWMRSKSYQVVSQTFSEILKEMFQIKQQFGKMSKSIVKKLLRGCKVNYYWDEACLIKRIYVFLRDFTLD